MRISLIIVLLLTAGLAAAAVYDFTWTGSTFANGVVLTIPGFFAPPVAEANRGVHLFACDRADWDSCTVRIDMGEIAQEGGDGRIELQAGGLADSTGVTMFFVREVDHLVHAPHPIDLKPGKPGKPEFN